jgi:hypothetical protein
VDFIESGCGDDYIGGSCQRPLIGNVHDFRVAERSYGYSDTDCAVTCVTTRGIWSRESQRGYRQPGSSNP